MNAPARTLRIFAQLFLLTLSLHSGQAFAVSLGDELILSRLGDPVEVEIEVLQWEDMDLERVEITAASRAEYEVFELTWLPVLDDLNFNLVGPDLDGNVRVLISSRAPLNEPFLELLLVLRWPGGSLRREYVLLFDPPGMTFTAAPPAATDAAPAVAVGPPPIADLPPLPVAEEAEPARLVALVAEVQEPVVSTSPQIAEPEPVAEPAPLLSSEPAPVPEPATTTVVVTAPPEPAPRLPALESETAEDEPVEQDEPSATETAAPPAELPDARTQIAIEVDTLAPQPAARDLDTSRRTYQVRAGDSLWNIARQFRPAGAGDNLYQMLLGIHDLNRSAFINGNISLLKANALLQMPTADDIATIDAAGAEAEFDRRWEQGTARFDAVQRGEAIPLFANSAPEEEVVPAVEPDLPPGVEAPAGSDDDNLIMVSATNTPQPLQLVSAPGIAPPDAGPATDLALNEPVPVATIAVVASADAVPAQTPDIVVARAVLTAELETEVDAMRTRRAAAEALAQQLQDSLQRSRAERAAQASLFGTQNLLLAGSALGLLLVLLAGGAFSLKLAGELRAQRDRDATNFDVGSRPGWLDDAGASGAEAARGEAARSAAARGQGGRQAPGTRHEPSLSNIEVVELDEPGPHEDAALSRRPAQDTQDLFARMDDMLGTSRKSPKN